MDHPKAERHGGVMCRANRVKKASVKTAPKLVEPGDSCSHMFQVVFEVDLVQTLPRALLWHIGRTK